MRAADPKTITGIAAAAVAIKRKKINVVLNLETGAFEVKNAKGDIVKTLAPAKGSDAIYIVNKTEDADDLKTAAGFLLDQRSALAGQAAEFETQFAEKQDELLKAIGEWHELNPGASRRDLSVQIGRLQNELSNLENKLRASQYKYREALPVDSIKRRTFAPHSFDDRVVPHPVYKLQATQTPVGLRIMPIK
jgi:hypothetical protein